MDLLGVKGTLKSFLQHHSSKASIVWCSAFFIVQLSHPYMTTGKMRELILRQDDKESRALEKEKGVLGSPGGEKDSFFPYIPSS